MKRQKAPEIVINDSDFGSSELNQENTNFNQDLASYPSFGKELNEEKVTKQPCVAPPESAGLPSLLGFDVKMDKTIRRNINKQLQGLEDDNSPYFLTENFSDSSAQKSTQRKQSNIQQIFKDVSSDESDNTGAQHIEMDMQQDQVTTGVIPIPHKTSDI